MKYSQLTQLLRKESLYKDRDAFGCDTTWISHRQFVDTSDHLAKTFQLEGITPEEPVLILQSSCHQYPLAMTALWRLGAVPIPLYTTTTRGEMESICQDAHPTFALVDEHTSHLDILQTLPKTCKILNVSSLITQNHGKFKENCATDDSIAAIIYTSGSSGTPKGVVHTHASLFNAVKNWSSLLREDHYFDRPLSELTYLNLFPSPSQITITNIIFTITNGNRTYLSRQNTLTEIINRIDQYGVQSVQLKPEMLREFIIESAHIDIHQLRTMQCWFTGGAAFTPEEVRRFEALFPGRVYLRYGLTEAPGGLIMHRPGKVRSGVGTCAPGCDVEIAPLPGEPNKTIGEIKIKTKSLARGYLNNSQEWTKVHRDGWFHTGDLGTIDKHGNVHVLSRIKNVIMSGTCPVWPSEVETVLRKIPDIKDCIVFGMPDDVLGEIVVAAIVLAPESTKTWQQIRTFYINHLLPTKQPRLIWLLDELPVSRVKVDVNKLKQTLTELAAQAAPMVSQSSFDRIITQTFAEYFNDTSSLRTSFKKLSDDPYVAAEICWRLRIIFNITLATSSLYNSTPLTQFKRQLKEQIGIGDH